MQADIGQALLLNRRQQFGDTINEGLTTDQVDFRMTRRLVRKVLPAAKTDLQPDLPRVWKQRLKVQIPCRFKRHTQARQQVLNQILLSGGEGASGPSAKGAQWVSVLVSCHVRSGLCWEPVFAACGRKRNTAPEFRTAGKEPVMSQSQTLTPYGFALGLGQSIRPGWLAWIGWTVAIGLLAAVWPHDVDFDVMHYQLQNGWSAYHGRLHQDLAPSEMHSFLNPAYNLAVWWLIELFPGPVVSFVLGCVQSLTLPALYLLIRRLSAACHLEMGWKTALALAGLGLVAAPSFTLFASLRNDDLGALAFVAALALALPPRGAQTSRRVELALAAFLVGAAAGMKLTNIVYIAGFAGFLLVLAKDWQARLQAGMTAAVAGGLGILTVGGPWMWVMWNEFANPVYPNFAGFFPGPDAPVDVTRDTRYLPTNLPDALTLPVRAAVNGRLINETQLVDIRLILAYVGALSLVAAALRARFGTYQARTPRPALALAAGTLVTLAAWIALFSIMRYAMAIWLLGPVMAWIAARLTLSEWPEAGRAWTYSGVCAGALLLTTQTEDTRRMAWHSWDERYVEITRPAEFDYDNSLILIASTLPAGFTATAFPEARITHIHPQAWSEPFLAQYRARRVDPLIESHDGPIYMILCRPTNVIQSDGTILEDVYPPEIALDSIRDRHDLYVSEPGCQTLETNFSRKSTIWQICPLSRG